MQSDWDIYKFELDHKAVAATKTFVEQKEEAQLIRVQ